MSTGPCTALLIQLGIVPERAVGVSTSRPVMPVLITTLRQIVTVWTRELNGSDTVSVHGEVLRTRGINGLRV